MSCSSVGSVCRISSFEVAVFQSVCESFFIVQVFAGVTASGTSSSFYHSHFGHLYWKLCLHWAPGLQTASLEKLLVSAAPSSAVSQLTHLYFSHVSFLLVSFWLFVCWTFYFPNSLILINLGVKYHMSFSLEGRGQQNYTRYYEQWMKSQRWRGIFM